MFVGERPGKEESARGRPFVGASGEVLWTFALRYLSLTRSEVYVTNLVKTFSGADELTDEEIALWGPELVREIEDVKPDTIVALGRHAASYLMGFPVAMETYNGIAMVSKHGLVIPVYHPAAGLHQPAMLSRTAWGLQQVNASGRCWVPDQVEGQYDRLYHYDRAEIGVLAIDTEGSVEDPISVQVSWKPGYGAVVSADDPHGIAAVRGMVSLARKVVFHHALHDIPVLYRMGISVPEEKIDDTMVRAYLLQTEPQGLKELAERHCGMDMVSFDDTVGPYWQRAKEVWEAKAIAALAPYTEGHDQTIERVSKKGKTLKPKVVKCKCQFCRLKLEKPAVRAVLEEEIGKAPEWSLRIVPETTFLRYAGRDPDATLRVHTELAPKITAMGLDGVLALDLACIPIIARMVKTGMPVDLTRHSDLSRWLKAESDRLLWEIRDEVDDPAFNPGSRDQVEEELFHGPGALLPPTRKRTKTGKISTGKLTLDAIKDSSRLASLVSQWREVDKLDTSFVTPLPSLIGRDGRLHPELKTTRVFTGRLSGRLLTFPARTEMGRRVRSIFVAGEGKVILSVDLSQIELRVLAEESGDENLINAFEVGFDLHVLTAERMSKILGHRVDRATGKTLNFAILFGLTPPGLAARTGLGVSEAEETIEAWFGVYPRVRPWMEKVWSEMRRDGYVRGPSGRIRYLPAIHLEGDRWEHLREEAKRQGVNHKIQEGAQRLMKLGMVEVWKDPLAYLWNSSFHAGEYYCEPLLQVHDELLFEVGEDEQEMVGTILKEAVIRGATLEGSRVPIEAKVVVGKSWGELDK